MICYETVKWILFNIAEKYDGRRGYIASSIAVPIKINAFTSSAIVQLRFVPRDSVMGVKSDNVAVYELALCDCSSVRLGGT